MNLNFVKQPFLTTSSMEKQEYYLLNILRGLSALFVLFFHFFVFFFKHQSTSAKLLQITPIDLPDPFYLQIINNVPVNIGHLAVAFFFLISGFLIQPSLERYVSLKTYLIHKIFRFWPSYLICFSMGLVFVMGFSALRESPFPYSVGHIFAYFFWVRDIFHYPFIDASVWSFEIQIKFYLFAGLIWSVGKKNFLEKICFSTLFMSLAIYGLYSFMDGADSPWFYLVTLARKNLKYFILILLGTCIYSFYKKQISGTKTLGLCILLLACFLSPLFSSPDISKTMGYLLAFFAFSYLILTHIKNIRSKGIVHRFLNWVSKISYPLYIGHVLPGYTIMYFMIDCGLSVYLGIFISLIYVFLMAEVVHKKIERPFINMSSKLFYFLQKKALDRNVGNYC